MKTVDGLLGFPDVHYGYCAEPCSDAAQCSGLARIRTCTPNGKCAKRCDPIIGLLDPAYLCPFGGTCLEGICTWQR
jgi:hypothetical protein